MNQEEMRQQATFLLQGLQAFVGDQTIDEWLADAPPFTKIEVDVLSIEAMVLLARGVLENESHE